MLGGQEMASSHFLLGTQEDSAASVSSAPVRQLSRRAKKGFFVQDLSSAKHAERVFQEVPKSVQRENCICWRVTSMVVFKRRGAPRRQVLRDMPVCCILL